MALSQEIIWTALPNGVDGDGRPQLSAMVSPRLRTDAEKARLGPDFVDFLDWPSRVNAMTFELRLDGGLAVPAERISPLADSKLWAKLFGDDTVVQSWEFRDLSNRNIRSFSVAGVMTYLHNVYEDIAKTSPGDLPPIGPLDGAPAPGTLGGLLHDLGRTTGHFRAPHGPGDRKRPELRERLTALLGTNAWSKEQGETPLDRATAWANRRRFNAMDPAFATARVVAAGADPAAFGFATQAAMDFYQAHRFYDRPEMLQEHLDAPDASKVPPPPAPPEVDFHRLLSFLADYPVLLRMLGLVVDLAVDPALPIGSGVMRLVPSAGMDAPLSDFNVNITPGTRYRHEKLRFEAETLPASDIGDGMLMLEGANDDFDPGSAGRHFHLVQIDPDGAALKLVNMASELWSVHSPSALMGKSFDTPDRAGLPTLRSTGLGVVRTERAVRMAERLGEEVTRNHASDLNDVVHFADHLLRGFRIDVLDGGTWRSLCQRRGTYTIHEPGNPPEPVTLPGGESIVDEGYVKSAAATSADAEDSDLYLHETLVRWDGWSLVAKRPGRTIVPHESPDRLSQTEEVEWHEPEPTEDLPMRTSFVPVARSLPRLRFGRSYRLRARTVDLAGNSLDPGVLDDSHATAPVLYGRFEPVLPPAIVPRAELLEGESIERLVIRSNFDQTAVEWGAAHGYSPVNDRHVVPPKTSQLMAETHGLFDAAMGATADPAAVANEYAKAVREAGTLATAPGSQMVEGTMPPDAQPFEDPDRAAPGGYLVNPEPLFELPYLPDAVGRGVALRGLPGTAEVWQQAFAGAWPDFAPFLLRLQERRGTVLPGECQETFMLPDEPPFWAQSEQRLDVFLGKAEVAVVRYSCYPGELVDHMAIWRRWLEPLSDSTIRDLVMTGGHWMISPYRTLHLVHAVQQPLCPPNVRLLSARDPGTTFAELRGKILLSVKSTGQVDLMAEWTEPVDSLSDVRPQELGGGGQVAALRVDARLPEPNPWLDPPPNADGTRPVPGQGGLPFGFPDLDHLIAIGFPIDDPEDLVEFRRPITHEFGDTRHRWVHYRVTGTTRFREYFPAKITADPANITRTGEPIVVNILSSVRPDAPRVLYLVPSFRWDAARVPERWTTFTRTRRGGGLRVWLDRPWYSSGEGEKLAVVLWPTDLQPPAFFEKLVSRFGRDPAWSSAVPSVTLQPGHFANAVDTDTGLTLDEAAGATNPAVRNATVSIAAFEPEYDEDRRLWFCDIDIAPKSAPSYYPFVRLALARYQRHSVTNAEKLSRVIQTDFAQLLPTRTLTVTFRDADTLDISVYGPAASGPLRNRVEVTLEHHDGEIPGDLGWTPVPAGQGRPNPVHLSDGVPDASWIPPKIPTGLRSKVELQRSGERFRLQGRPAIARDSLPTMRTTEVASLVGRDPATLGPAKELPIILIPGFELWSGPMELPPDRATLGPLRIVVREFEHYVADDDVGKLDTDKQDPHISGRYLDRVVYADIVELPSR